MKCLPSINPSSSSFLFFHSFRLNQVVRQSQVPGANMANAAAKADAIKEECEEATLKMETIKVMKICFFFLNSEDYISFVLSKGSWLN